MLAYHSNVTWNVESRNAVLEKRINFIMVSEMEFESFFRHNNSENQDFFWKSEGVCIVTKNSFILANNFKAKKSFQNGACFGFQ